MGVDYVPKVGKIIVVTLTLADTWYPVLTEAQSKSIRGYKIKSRLTFNSSGNPTAAPKPFDLALSLTPDSGDSDGSGFYSLSGQGSGDTFGPSNGLWASSSVAGTVIEIITFL